MLNALFRKHMFVHEHLCVMSLYSMTVARGLWARLGPDSDRLDRIQLTVWNSSPRQQQILSVLLRLSRTNILG